MVKEGIRKMKFTEHLKRAEGGKTPKVELTISVDGVAIQEPKGKKILHQFPLHHLSYCADDKSEKKFFSFIAKHPSVSDQHVCFVFVSDKLAEEITLTIGQAFDLAYRKFLETSGRDLEMRRQLMVLQKRVQELEKENVSLKTKLDAHEKCKNGKCKKVTTFIKNDSPQTLTPIPKPPASSNSRHNSLLNGTVSLLDMEVTPTVGTKLQNLSIDEMDDFDDDDFNPRAIENLNNSSSSSSSSSDHNLSNNQTNEMSELGSSGKITIDSNGYHSNDEEKDIFGCEPFNPNPEKVTTKTSNSTSLNDPFGMDSFAEKELEDAIGAIDKKLADMRVRFTDFPFIYD